MKTEYLIHALVADGARPVIPIRRTLLRAFGVAVVLALLSLFIRHPRADIAQAFSTTPFVFKVAVLLSVASTSVVLLLDTAGPASAPRRRWLLMLAPLLLAAAILWELVTVPSPMWPAHLIGHNAARCLALVPLISAAPLACLLFALRSGAPARPGLAGATAGLLAGGIAATVYAVTCPDDSPLFIAAWYSTAIAIVTGVSAFIGGRLLRW